MRTGLGLIFLAALTGCLAGPTSPLGPSPQPTATPQPVCSWVDLGAMAPGMTQGPLTIRNASDWGAYKAQPYVAVVNWGPAPATVIPTELDHFDFSQQMVLVFSALQGSNIRFSQACICGGRLKIAVNYTYNDAIGPYITAQAHAVAVPLSSLPQDWTICETDQGGVTCTSVSVP